MQLAWSSRTSIEHVGPDRIHSLSVGGHSMAAPALRGARDMLHLNFFCLNNKLQQTNANLPTSGTHLHLNPWTQSAVHPPQECPGHVRTAFVRWEKPQPTPVVIPRTLQQIPTNYNKNYAQNRLSANSYSFRSTPSAASRWNAQRLIPGVRSRKVPEKGVMTFKIRTSFFRDL